MWHQQSKHGYAFQINIKGDENNEGLWNEDQFVAKTKEEARNGKIDYDVNSFRANPIDWDQYCIQT